MAEYETEEEQLRAIKEWWNENGRSVVAGVVIGIAGLGGWKFWSNQQEQQALVASDLYASISGAITAQDVDTILATSEELKENYSRTPYAAHGALLLAKAKADEGDLPATIENLRWVIDNSKQENIKAIAQLRLARVYIADNALDDAQALLNSDYPLAYQSLLMEVRGDLHLKQGDVEAARDAYDRAIDSAELENVAYLKMKRDNLGS